jgi:mannose-6-phosphate isomerase-like protein (cupin superfamily)
VFVVESGEGTLVLGGKMVDEKPSGANEVRGSGITGGTERKLAPGDMVAIPAKVPHQVKVDAGKQISYIVVKVTQ